MKNIIFLTLLLITPLAVQANIRIFACEPEWEALATEMGGDKIEVSSATNALQDPHYIQARPSLISKVGRADLIVCSGAELEIGWLPMLLQKGNNPRVMPGSQGFLEASQFVKRLDVAESADRSQGDVHPQGNPHIQTDPHNILLVAEVMAERMARTGPGQRRHLPAKAGGFWSTLDRCDGRLGKARDGSARQTGDRPPQVLGVPGKMAGTERGCDTGAIARHTTHRESPGEPVGTVWRQGG